MRRTMSKEQMLKLYKWISIGILNESSDNYLYLCQCSPKYVAGAIWSKFNSLDDLDKFNCLRKGKEICNETN